MSYSYDVKKTLYEQKKSLCCKKSEIYGFLLASNTFTLESIKIYTDNLDILNFYIKTANSLIGQKATNLDKVEIKGKQALKYKLTIGSEEVDALLRVIGVNMKTVENHEVDFSVLKKDGCKQFFIRGVFIACGFVSNPKKTYHAEFILRFEKYLDAIVDICNELGINLKKSKRKKEYVAYIKTAEGVKDFLAMIGASEFAFEYMNAEIEKELKNSINRISNCDMANMDKSIIAAEKQVQAIRKLELNGYSDISDELKQIAILRLENRECSLEELSKMIDPPLSKSGVNHRLKKIIELAERIK